MELIVSDERNRTGSILRSEQTESPKADRFRVFFFAQYKNTAQCFALRRNAVLIFLPVSQLTDGLVIRQGVEKLLRLQNPCDADIVGV